MRVGSDESGIWFGRYASDCASDCRLISQAMTQGANNKSASEVLWGRVEVQ